jgi:hypothetical protein
VVRVTALAAVLTFALDWVAARVSRSMLRVDASKTLGGTLATRAAAWWIAWKLVRPHRERPADRPRLRA